MCFPSDWLMYWLVLSRLKTTDQLDTNNSTFRSLTHIHGYIYVNSSTWQPVIYWLLFSLKRITSGFFVEHLCSWHVLSKNVIRVSQSCGVLVCSAKLSSIEIFSFKNKRGKHRRPIGQLYSAQWAAMPTDVRQRRASRFCVAQTFRWIWTQPDSSCTSN